MTAKQPPIGWFGIYLFFIAFWMLGFGAGWMCFYTPGRDYSVPLRIRVSMLGGGYIEADQVEKDVWVESPSWMWERVTWVPIKVSTESITAELNWWTFKEPPTKK